MMTDKSISESLLNQLLVKCSAELERRALYERSADQSARITFEKNRCVRTLFPKSSCGKCVQVCRPQVLSLKNQFISIEESGCTGCGACVRACSTEAFSFGQPTLFTVLTALKQRLSNLRADAPGPQTLTFVCPKATRAGEECLTGCFCGVNPSLLLLAHLIFKAEIKLHCSDCKKCSAASLKNPAHALISACEKLSSDLGIDFRPTLFEEKPESIADLKRRRIFSRLSERLQGIYDVASFSGAAPKTEKVFPMLEREVLLAAIQILKAQIPKFEIQDKFFPLPGVFKGKCTGCNLCVLLCPSGCLTGKSENQSFKLLADPLRCIDCGRCVEVCPPKAMVMRTIPGTEKVISDSIRIVLAEVHMQTNEAEQTAEDRMREIFHAPIYRS